MVLGAAAALVVGAAVALLPGDLLATQVSASGIADLVPAAQPPLGNTARALLALAAAGLAGAVAWSLAVLLLPTRRPAPAGMKLKRADAHPDAPARAPIRAAEELGEPLPPPTPSDAAARPLPVIEAVAPQPLPRNLDTPLAALDPTAIPDVPRPPVRAVPPLAPRAQAERIETFALTPTVRTAPAAPTPITSLLDRLERAPRPIAPAPDRIAETLGQLRRLAAG